MAAQGHHQVRDLMLAQLKPAQGGFQGLTNWPGTCEPILDRNHSSAEFAWGTSRDQTIWPPTSAPIQEKSHLPVKPVAGDLHDLMNAGAIWKSTWENKQRKRRRQEKLWPLNPMELFHPFTAGLLSPHPHLFRSQWPRWILSKKLLANGAGAVRTFWSWRTLLCWQFVNI